MLQLMKQNIISIYPANNSQRHVIFGQNMDTDA